jgi:hypothetical protein
VDTPGQILVRRTKRLWTDEEKRSICVRTAAPGVSVARRSAVNANMVFKWLRDPRYSPEVSPANGPTFLPVEIVDQHRNTILSPVPGLRHRLAISRSSWLAGTGCGSAANMIPRRWCS